MRAGIRHFSSRTGKVSGVGLFLGLIALAVAGVISPSVYYASKSIHDLLGENSKLKENISRLTTESQIGYAKVLEQFERDGKKWTRLLFATTNRDDAQETLLKREYEIEGDVVHFDALIVKFAGPLVMDGKERAIYLWRRVYGEHMPPEQGYSVDDSGLEPRRYESICRDLSLDEKQMFWEEIWDLANDLDRLSDTGIKAVYGNVVYQNLRPGFIYVFKINNSGELYPETIPDL